MTQFSENFCLKWNDFQQNITNSYHDLRKESDFSDVTLLCEGEQQIEAHKVILNASSSFFSSVLKRNKHSHPMIYMRGLKPKDLVAIMDFIYHGEANIYQEDLDRFLILAEELQLKGLSGTKQNDTDSAEEHSPNTEQQQPIIKGHAFEQQNLNHPPIPFDNQTNTDSKVDNHPIVPVDASKTIGIADISMEDIKTRVESMMERVNGADNILKCTVCGKETKGNRAKIVLRQHIQTHIEGLSYPCNQCDIVSRTSNALHVHVSRNHRNKNPV